MVDDPQTYINDDRYVAQEKKDGERRPAERDDAFHTKGFNKKGQEVPLPGSIVKSINSHCLIDGEIVGEKLHVFDLLSYQGASLKNHAYVDRLLILNQLTFGDAIQVVYTAHTKEEKQKLYDFLVKNNAEGIVFKLKSSTYKAGRPASGGDHLKHKFYAEATFIVSGITKGKRSVALELIGENQERIPMGKVTIPPNKDIPKVGDFVEVKYLYAFKGGAIFQSEYKWKRKDCDLTDATITQLKFKKEVA
jgi:bifunctional non-homologous end joining protein LigD